MVIDWNHFTKEEWNGMTGSQWLKFYENLIFCLQNSRALPFRWRRLMVERLQKAKSRNAWADFNCAARGWENIKKGTRPLNHSIFCLEDLPSFPDTEDFTNLDKPRDCERS